jgi:hypothetical protein
VGPTAGLEYIEKKEISHPRRDSNPGPSSPQPSPYTNYANPVSFQWSGIFISASEACGLPLGRCVFSAY